MKTILALFIGALVLGSLILFFGTRTPRENVAQKPNTTIPAGTSVIDIVAKGGYAPKLTTAQANVPTMIRVTTKGTFDCSSSLSIPSLNYRTNLPPSGTTLINVPPQEPGTTLEGTCSMGMYNFAINFK